MQNREYLYSQLMDICYKVHTTLGPGLLESSYEACLYYELQKSNIYVERQIALPLIYADVKLDIGYRIDLILENQIIVEVKSVENLNETHKAQLLTYLKLSGCELGMLINFNVASLKNGMKRFILTKK